MPGSVSDAVSFAAPPTQRSRALTVAAGLLAAAVVASLGNAVVVLLARAADAPYDASEAH